MTVHHSKGLVARDHEIENELVKIFVSRFLIGNETLPLDEMIVKIPT